MQYLTGETWGQAGISGTRGINIVGTGTFQVERRDQEATESDWVIVPDSILAGDTTFEIYCPKGFLLRAVFSGPTVWVSGAESG